MAKVLVMVGTRKGAFFCWSDEERREWRIEGPVLKGWEVQDLKLDRRGEPAVYAALGHAVWGPTIQVSRDFGRSWNQIEHGPAYAEDAGRKLERVWVVEPAGEDRPGVLYAGVAEAGLFVSDDGGEHWREVPGLNDHPTRPGWQPGAGGLCAHSIVIDPKDPRRMWVGISAVGVFRSDDGGDTWEVKNQGLPIAVPSKEHGAIGSCVHSLVVSSSEPGVLYQQNHQGVFRSADGAESWQRIEDGLPSTFGFPMIRHPGEARTLYTLPLESDEYRFFVDGRPAVYRSRDGGDSWQALSAGLPDGPVYTSVLRNALAADGLPSCGIYFGTTGGQVFYSRDEGERWQALPALFPRVGSVSAAAVE